MTSRLAVLPVLLATLPGCALFFTEDDDGRLDADLHDVDGSPIDAAPRADAMRPPGDASPCDPQVKIVATEPSPHVSVGTDVTYPTNPPSSGPHWPAWARWNQTYDQPALAREYYVHNLEHGGVVFLYNCPGGCAGDVASLEALEDALPKDPKCTAPVRTRTLVARDPELPAGVTFAAAAWGATYTSTCLDVRSLRLFYEDFVARAPEDLCAQGSAP